MITTHRHFTQQFVIKNLIFPKTYENIDLVCKYQYINVVVMMIARPTQADFSTYFGTDYPRIAQNNIDLSDISDRSP